MNGNILKLKMILNKKNGQRNISLPKKKTEGIPKSAKFIKVKFEGWE
jgi:hypothetical protein